MQATLRNGSPIAALFAALQGRVTLTQHCPKRGQKGIKEWAAKGSECNDAIKVTGS